MLVLLGSFCHALFHLFASWWGLNRVRAFCLVYGAMSPWTWGLDNAIFCGYVEDHHATKPCPLRPYSQCSFINQKQLHWIFACCCANVAGASICKASRLLLESIRENQTKCPAWVCTKVWLGTTVCTTSRFKFQTKCFCQWETSQFPFKQGLDTGQISLVIVFCTLRVINCVPATSKAWFPSWQEAAKGVYLLKFLEMWQLKKSNVFKVGPSSQNSSSDMFQTKSKTNEMCDLVKWVLVFCLCWKNDFNDSRNSYCMNNRLSLPSTQPVLKNCWRFSAMHFVYKLTWHTVLHLCCTLTCHSQNTSLISIKIIDFGANKNHENVQRPKEWCMCQNNLKTLI